MQTKIVANRILCFFILLVQGYLGAQITQSAGGTTWENHPSSRILLNGNWQFKWISGSSWSSYSTFYQTIYDASAWGTLQVPANWEMKGIAPAQYVVPADAVGLYRTSFEVPAAWADSSVYLRFDGVLMGYEVWVNNSYAGKWETAYNSRQFNISPYLRSGNNLLAVRVYTRYPGYEFDTHDDWGYSGIFRDVSLVAVAHQHLNYFSVQTAVNGSDGNITVDYAVSDIAASTLQNISVKGTLYDPSGNVAGSFLTSITESVPGASDTIRETLPVPAAALWTAETPSLYTLSIVLLKNNIPIQNFDQRVGIREVKIVNRQILFNDKPVKFRGVNYHESDPYLGKALNRQHRLKDLLMMKKANINYIRTAHYPPHPEFFDLCDSLGIYVSCEVPFGFGDNYLSDTAYKRPLMNRADATVSRHRNHACIFMWSIGNENEITSMTAEVGLHVAQMDSTRLICYPQAGGMFYWRDYNNYPAQINVFTPHYPDIVTVNTYLANAHRPLIFTEMSHSLGSAFEDHDKLWDCIQQNTLTAGGAVWDWADQAVAKTGSRTDNFTQTSDVWLSSTNYFTMNGNQGADGIVFAERTPQSDYWEVRKNYAQVRVSVRESHVVQGTQNVSVPIQNLYDFVNLNEMIHAEWYLTKDKDTIQSGNFIPVCAPGDSITQLINLTIPADPSLNIYLLHLNFFTNANQHVNDHVVRLLPTTGKQDLMTLLSDASLTLLPALVASPDSISASASSYHFALSTFDGMITLNNTIKLVQKGPFIRTGRRATLAEQAAIPSRLISRYIMNNVFYTHTADTSIGDTALVKGSYLYNNNNIQMQGNIDYRLIKNGAIEVRFAMTPAYSGPVKLLQESGVAFLLNKNITEVRWLGFGPFSSNKGKQNLNNYGLFYGHQNDIYFEGNKRGIDIMLLTDNAGSGIMILADSSNVSLEKTDQGIIVTFNTHLTGLGSKFAETAYPVYPATMGNMTGSFRMIPVDGNNWYALLNNLFGNPAAKGMTTTPFIATSDTYPQKLSTVTDGASGCLPTATASTFQTGNGPANTLDDNLTTRWSADGDGVYITYAFCNLTQVSGIKISFQNGQYRTSTFDLLSSVDGITYTVVRSDVVSSGTTNDLETFFITPVTANYFRIVGHGNSQNTWTSIQEVKFISQAVVTAILGEGNTYKQINLFPNPAITELHIETNERIKKIEIISVDGKCVEEINGSAIKSIPVSGLRDGIYLIKITTDKDVFLSRFQKI